MASKRKSGPHKSTTQFLADWTAIYPREKKYHRRSKTEIASQIAELRDMLRQGKTKSGEPISRLLALEITKLIDRQAKILVAGVSKKKIKEIKEKTAGVFVEMGIRKLKKGADPYKDPVEYISERVKRAKISVRRATKRQEQAK